MPAMNIAKPHIYDHSHADVGTGWLRPAVFGAMDGLVSNIGLITGIAAAGASPGTMVITGISGMIAGGVSMALGEYTSVKTQNEQLDSEVRVESDALKRNPRGEELELADQFKQLGMTETTAKQAAREVHANHDSALRVHLANELGLSLDDRQSPLVAALASFFAFSIGALVPVLPFLFGLSSVWVSLAFGGFGLLIAGALAARFSKRKLMGGAVRQLVLGTVAVGVTFAIGKLMGVSGVG